MTEQERYRIGLDALRSPITDDEWTIRRSKFESWRTLPSSPSSDPYPSEARPIDDEFGWYLFNIETTLQDPYALDPDEAARILPIVSGLASRWHLARRVDGLQEKLKELAGPRRMTPDSALFEIAVALAYAEIGFDVSLIPEEPGVRKTPDLVVRKGDIKVFVECKRQSRLSEYQADELQHWNRIWAPVEALLIKIGNPVWLRIDFRTELSMFDEAYLVDRLTLGLSLVHAPTVLLDNELVKVEARPVQLDRLQAHLNDTFVKVGGTQERDLLGGQWASPRSTMESRCFGARMKPTTEIPAWKARSFWDRIDWGCGATWVCSAEQSIERKARDIKTLFARAIEQLPTEQLGIVHVAVDTLSGNDVEVRRTEKVMSSISTFRIDRPVVGLLLHRVQTESPPSAAFNFDESVTDFWVDKRLREDFPKFVFVPATTKARTGGHWEYY